MGPLERLWQKEFASPHISYFSPANLRLLVERHSAMRLVEVFPLPATSRRGLRSRIGRSDARLREWVMFAAAWSLTFLLPWLPSDIAVLVFRRSDVPRSVS